MNPLDSLGATLFSILTPLSAPFQLIGLLIITIIQLLLGQPTFCSSAATCL